MPNFELLLQKWPMLGPILPWLSLAVLLGIIVVTLMRYRRGLQWIQIRTSRLGEQLKNSRQGLWHFLGIATLQDLLVSKSHQANVTRLGLLWTLTEDFWKVATTRDELDIDFPTLHGMIQGPFCIECGTRLYEPTPGIVVPDGLVIAPKCPRADCARSWTRRKDTPPFEHLKRSLLRRLQAELRIHHKISPEQEPPVIKRRRNDR